MTTGKWSPEAIELSGELAAELGQVAPPLEVRAVGGMGQPESGPERTTVMEAKVFVESKDAVIHFTVEGDVVAELLAGVNDVLGWAEQGGFLAHHGFGGSKGGSPANGSVAPQEARGPAIDSKCVFCGGESWDNRQNKKNPKAPDFRCKNRDECGAGGWLQKDGTVKWSEPQL